MTLVDQLRTAALTGDEVELRRLEPLVTAEAHRDSRIGIALLRVYDEMAIPPDARAISVLDVIAARREQRDQHGRDESA